MSVLLKCATFQALTKSRFCGISTCSYNQGTLRPCQLQTVFRLQLWRGIVFTANQRVALPGVPVSEPLRASINSKSSSHLLWAHRTLPYFTACLFVEAVTVTQISPIRFPVQGDSPYIIWHREAIKLLRFLSPKLLRFLSPEVICCWRTWHLKQRNYNFAGLRAPNHLS